MTSKKILDSALCPVCGDRVLFSKNLVFGANGVLCHWDCLKGYLGEEGFAIKDTYPKIKNPLDFKNYLESLLQISIVMSGDKNKAKVQAIIQKYSEVFDFLDFKDVKIYQLVKDCTVSFCALL